MPRIYLPTTATKAGIIHWLAAKIGMSFCTSRMINYNEPHNDIMVNELKVSNGRLGHCVFCMCKYIRYDFLRRKTTCIPHHGLRNPRSPYSFSTYFHWLLQPNILCCPLEFYLMLRQKCSNHCPNEWLDALAVFCFYPLAEYHNLLSPKPQTLNRVGTSTPFQPLQNMRRNLHRFCEMAISCHRHPTGTWSSRSQRTALDL